MQANRWNTTLTALIGCIALLAACQRDSPVSPFSVESHRPPSLHAVTSDFAETTDVGNTLATAEPVTLGPGVNTVSGDYGAGDDIDFFAIDIPTSGYVTLNTSPTSGGVGSIPALSLFQPDGTLYMVDAYAHTLTALIPGPGTWYVAMSVYRDYPTRYFPTQMPSSAGDPSNGGSLGDGTALLFGEDAQIKPKAPLTGDASFRTPNLGQPALGVGIRDLDINFEVQH